MLRLQIISRESKLQLTDDFQGIGQDVKYGSKWYFTTHFGTEQNRDDFWTSLLLAHVCGFTKFNERAVVFTCEVDDAMIAAFRNVGIEVTDERQLEPA